MRTFEELKEKIKPRNNLEEDILKIVFDNADGDFEEILVRITKYGVSQIIGTLAYDSDSARFFNKHIMDINKMISCACLDYKQQSFPITTIIPELDINDILIREAFNQHLVIHYVFYEITKAFFDRLYSI